jgi:DNA polymerase III subunit delta'
MWRTKGQNKIIDMLKRSIREQNMAHAYLLSGPAHVGKRTLAIEFAQALNCEAPDPPCGNCRSCRHIAEGKHPDIIFVNLELAAEISRNSNTGDPSPITKIGIDCVKELQRLANFPPYEGRYRVFIFEEAVYLSNEASNSLLKILEEPPVRVMWLLISNEKFRLLPTVVSRCQQLKLKPMNIDELRDMLINDHDVEAEKAEFLARLSRGCPGWALSAIVDNSIMEERLKDIDMIATLMSAGIEQRFNYVGRIATELSRDREALNRVITSARSWWRDLMYIKCDCQEAVVNVDYQKMLEQQSRNLSLTEIESYIKSLYSVEEQISQNVNIRLAFESLMISMPRIPTLAG